MSLEMNDANMCYPCQSVLFAIYESLFRTLAWDVLI